MAGVWRGRAGRGTCRKAWRAGAGGYGRLCGGCKGDREESSIKAIASVNIGGAFAMHGIKVIDSYKGMFVSMPSESYTDRDGNKQYKEICHPINGAARNELVQKVQDAYRQALEEQQSENEAQAESEPLAQGM